ncbi:MAG: hypothetical protein RSD62_04820, partial [Ruthenibacterium sp.]
CRFAFCPICNACEKKVLCANKMRRSIHAKPQKSFSLHAHRHLCLNQKQTYFMPSGKQVFSYA